MGAGYHGGFGPTKGKGIPIDLQFFASKVFDAGGRVTEKSFSIHGSFFLSPSPPPRWHKTSGVKN